MSAITADINARGVKKLICIAISTSYLSLANYYSSGNRELKQAV